MKKNGRVFLKIVCIALLSAPLCGVLTAESARQRPNIILCMADDQGWGDVGYYGHPIVKTPNLDRLAEHALRFDRFYAAAPVCSPTRASVLTGRNPNRCNVLNHGRSYRPQEITLAEALKTAGYVTGHFGKWHVGSVQKTSPVNPGNSGFDEWLSCPNYFDLDPILSHNGVAKPYKGDSSDITVDAALDFIRKQSKGPEPFLAVVWFPAPHGPHKTLPADADLYKGLKHQGYFAEITTMDRAFGRLRRELRNLNIRDNTLLWYCSDNGGLVSESAGGRDKKGSIYEGGLRVPCLIEWPARIHHPQVTRIPASTSDIYPTLLNIVGVRMKDQPPLDGISLVKVLDNKMTTRPQPMGFWRHPTPGRLTYSSKLMNTLLKAQKQGKEVGEPSRLDLDAGDITKQYPEDSFPGHAAWLDWPWKLHRLQAPLLNKRRHLNAGGFELELYNLVDDPQEETNLAEKHPKRVQSMRSDLEAWQKSVMRSLNGKDYGAGKEASRDQRKLQYSQPAEKVQQRKKYRSWPGILLPN